MSTRARIGKIPFTTIIEAGKHRWISDEPLESDGQNQGPTPIQLLESAIASCACITMRMYADRKGWDLLEVSVTLDHQPGGGNSENIFLKSVEVKGNLTEEQIKRLIDIGGRCPVVKILSGKVNITLQE